MPRNSKLAIGDAIKSVSKQTKKIQRKKLVEGRRKRKKAQSKSDTFKFGIRAPPAFINVNPGGKGVQAALINPKAKNHHDPTHKVSGILHESQPLPAEPVKRSKIGREVAARVKQERAAKDAKAVSLVQKGSFQTVPHSVGGFVIPGKN